MSTSTGPDPFFEELVAVMYTNFNEIQQFLLQHAAQITSELLANPYHDLTRLGGIMQLGFLRTIMGRQIFTDDVIERFARFYGIQAPERNYGMMFFVFALRLPDQKMLQALSYIIEERTLRIFERILDYEFKAGLPEIKAEERVNLPQFHVLLKNNQKWAVAVLHMTNQYQPEQGPMWWILGENPRWAHPFEVLGWKRAYT